MIKSFNEFIEEGVFRNSIIRTSGTGIKRREEQMDYIPVDLGLPSGTLWCDRNVGATSPEDYGGYFQWGGTEEMTVKGCDYDTCPYWNAKKHMFEKYNSIDRVDDRKILEMEDDAAHVNMGGGWYIPTAEQCNELMGNTDIEWTRIKGVRGKIFKSKKNGNSIFIPCAGFRESSSLNYSEINFCVWSSSVSSNDSRTASYIQSSFDWVNDLAGSYRYFGFSVRGVMDNKSK